MHPYFRQLVARPPDIAAQSSGAKHPFDRRLGGRGYPHHTLAGKFDRVLAKHRARQHVQHDKAALCGLEPVERPILVLGRGFGGFDHTSIQNTANNELARRGETMGLAGALPLSQHGIKARDLGPSSREASIPVLGFHRRKAIRRERRAASGARVSLRTSGWRLSVSIGIIGSGTVGKVLATGYANKGHAVVIGSRSPEKLAEWTAGNPAVKAVDVAAAAAADVVIFAVAGRAAADAVAIAGAALDGKVVIDACNPIAGPPVNGFVPYFTGHNDSLMEQLQRLAPKARFVKAFNSVGNALMIDPKLPARPSMYICGNDREAKSVVAALLAEVGWNAEDIGGVELARAIEPLCQLWCASGFAGHGWSHVVTVVRPGG